MQSLVSNIVVKGMSILGALLLTLGFVSVMGSRMGLLEDRSTAMIALGLGIVMAVLSLAVLHISNSELSSDADSAKSALDILGSGGQYADTAGSPLLRSIAALSSQLNERAKFLERLASGEPVLAPDVRSENDALTLACRRLNTQLRDDLRSNGRTSPRTRAAIAADLDRIANFDLSFSSGQAAESDPDLAAACDRMTDNLRAVLLAVSGMIGRLEISASAAQQAAEGARRPPSAFDLASMLSSATRQLQAISDLISESLSKASDTVKTARRGTELADENLDSMNSIRKHLQEAAKRVKRVGERSQEVSQFVHQISEFSDHTSLVALNATLQSPSAGLPAERYSLVADEIELVAERARALLSLADTLAKGLQSETKDALASVDVAVNEVVVGTAVIKDSACSFTQFEEASSRLVDSLRNASDAIESNASQAFSITNVAADEARMAGSAEINQKRSEQSIAETVRLTSELRTLVGRFNLSSPARRSERPEVPPRALIN
jgi:methyl-accepting chemotaxis protein